MKLITSSLKATLVVFIAASTPFLPATAQTRVVVIPLSADDPKPLANVISVAKENGDFADLVEAMDSINDAEENNPYLIVVAPGIYDLGSQSLTIKSHVSVQGAGIDKTIITSSAMTEDVATVEMESSAIIGHVTVRQDTDTPIGSVFGIIARGTDFEITSCKIEAKNPAFRGIGFGVDLESLAQGEVRGVLHAVHFAVPNPNDFGLGELTSFNSGFARVLVENSVFQVLSSGTAISSLGLDRDDQHLIVSSSTIELLGEGAVGIGNTDGDGQLYQNVTIISGADNVAALRGAGSGFRPVLENSKVQLTGSGTFAAITNNGRPKIRNSTLEADIVFSRFSQSVFTPTYEVDGSVLRGRRIVGHDSTDANLIIRFGTSKLDAFTPFEADNGTITATCANSYDRNYTPLSEGCN